MRKKLKKVKEIDGTLFLFLNHVAHKTHVEELEKEIAEKTGKKVVILDSKFRETIISM